MKKEVVRVKVNGESIIRGAKCMIEKRRFRLHTVTIVRGETMNFIFMYKEFFR